LHRLPIRRAQKLSPELVLGQDDQLHPQALARSNAYPSRSARVGAG
jgi:hypothetical protein